MKKFREIEGLGARVASARKRQMITQMELARRTGVAQSALSMFEKGADDALSDANIERVLQALEIRLDEKVQEVLPRLLAYCSGFECLGAHAHKLGGTVKIEPRWIKIQTDAVSSLFCELCGEQFVQRCQNCEAPITMGFHCPNCGDPYIAETPQELKLILGESSEALALRVTAFNTERESIRSLLAARTDFIEIRSGSAMRPEKETRGEVPLRPDIPKPKQ